MHRIHICFRMSFTNMYQLLFCNNYLICYMIAGNTIVNIPVQYSKAVNNDVFIINDNAISYTNLGLLFSKLSVPQISYPIIFII